MPLVGAAVVPHSPLLIPGVAKDHAPLGEPIRQAVIEVGQILYATQATDVVMLTPHGPRLDGQVVSLTGETLTGDLREFGDLQPWSAPPAMALAQHFNQGLQHHGLSGLLQSSQSVDYGTIVPWRLFDWPRLPRILPVSVAHLTSDQLINLGRALIDTLQTYRDRAVVVASSDFSRRHGHADRHDRPTSLERQIARAIRSRRLADLPAFSQRSCCGVAPMYVVLSALEGRAGEASHIVTAAPYGVGAITAWLSV